MALCTTQPRDTAPGDQCKAVKCDTASAQFRLLQGAAIHQKRLACKGESVKSHGTRQGTAGVARAQPPPPLPATRSAGPLLLHF